MFSQGEAEKLLHVPQNFSMFFRAWFSRYGGDGLTVGLDDLRGLFQPE